MQGIGQGNKTGRGIAVSFSGFGPRRARTYMKGRERLSYGTKHKARDMLHAGLAPGNAGLEQRGCRPAALGLWRPEVSALKREAFDGTN
jgi:hypothetical protein